MCRFGGLLSPSQITGTLGPELNTSMEISIRVLGDQSRYLWRLEFGRQQAGTATGNMNFFAYLFAGAGELLFGSLIESRGNTSMIFIVVACATAASAVFASLVRR